MAGIEVQGLFLWQEFALKVVVLTGSLCAKGTGVMKR